MALPPSEQFIPHSDVEKHDERNPAVMAPTVSVGFEGEKSDQRASVPLWQIRVLPVGLCDVLRQVAEVQLPCLGLIHLVRHYYLSLCSYTSPTTRPSLFFCAARAASAASVATTNLNPVSAFSIPVRRWQNGSGLCSSLRRVRSGLGSIPSWTEKTEMEVAT